MPSTHQRSADLLAAIVSHLRRRGETSLSTLARHVGSHSSHLAQARYLYNLRLATRRAPYRIVSRLVRNRSYWRLVPVDRPIPTLVADHYHTAAA